MTPWPAAHQASLSSTTSWTLLKFMFIESVMLSNHLLFCQRLADYKHVGLSLGSLFHLSILSITSQFFKKVYLFLFGCAGSLLLGGLFFGCGEWGLLSSCSAQASHRGGFSRCVRASVLAVHRLSCPMVHGIFPDQEPVYPALAGRFFTTEPPGKPGPTS